MSPSGIPLGSGVFSFSADGQAGISGQTCRNQTRYGEQDMAQVNMRQNDARISEITVDGKRYATTLCA